MKRKRIVGKVIKGGCYIIMLCACLDSCVNNRDKSKHWFTAKLDKCNSLYVELFVVSSYGVYGGDIRATYLTDSISFRKYIGVCDDHEFFRYECKGDSIVITKSEEVGIHSYKVVEKRVLSLSDLRQQNKFE